MNSDQYISAYLNYGFTNNAITETQSMWMSLTKGFPALPTWMATIPLSGNMYYSKGFSKLHFRMGLDLSFYRSNNVAIINEVKNKTRKYPV
jgi:hypothetical protein